MLVTADSYIDLVAHSWAELPDKFRDRGPVDEWSLANRAGRPCESFLEGPCLSIDGSVLHCVDIPHGRLFAIDAAGTWSQIAGYDGWPNGLKLRPDGRFLIADYKNGLVEIDRGGGGMRVVLSHRNSQRFMGLNDLQVVADGTVWFTDQGQSGLHDPSGRVYRLAADGTLACVLEGLPSPNGLRLAPGGRELFVAMTRDNSVWRAPLMASGEASKVGRFAMFYGPTGPDGLELDSHGRLWVCLPGADSIWVLNSSGETVARARFSRGAFPTNLVLHEAKQRAYVTCSGAQAIYIIDYSTLNVAG